MSSCSSCDTLCPVSTLQFSTPVSVGVSDTTADALLSVFRIKTYAGSYRSLDSVLEEATTKQKLIAVLPILSFLAQTLILRSIGP